MDEDNKLDYLSDGESKALQTAANSSRDKAIIKLFLGAGLRLTELSELTIESIQWDKKIIHVGGKHARDIPINDELYSSLTAWTHDRKDNTSTALFTTSKGQFNGMTIRAIDKMLRKYGHQAGIKKHLNAKILRNTFAVHLLTKETSIDNASCILGLTEPDSLRRYTKAAHELKEGKVETNELDKLDTRSKIVKKISKLIQKKPKGSKVIQPVVIDTSKDAVIGRDAVLAEIKENLSKQVSTLLVGSLGIGKTCLLKKVATDNGYLYLDSPTPLKQFLQKICEKYCPDWKDRLPAKSRSSAKEIVDLLTNVLKNSSSGHR